MRYIAFTLVLLLLLPSIVTATQTEHDWLYENLLEAVSEEGSWAERATNMRAFFYDIEPEGFSEDCLDFAYMTYVYSDMMASTSEAMSAPEGENESLARVYIYLANTIITAPEFNAAANDCLIGL